MTEHEKFVSVLNGYTYVIPKVNRSDAKYLVKIAEKYSLKECISKFLQENDWNHLTNSCVSEDDVGLHLMGMICFYEMGVIKTSGFRRTSIKDIKRIISKVEKYHDFEFLKDDPSRYKLHLLSLNQVELEKESLVVERIRRKVNSLKIYYLKTINGLKTSIETTLVKKRVYENDVRIYIDKLFDFYIGIKDKSVDFHLDSSKKIIKTNIKDIDSLMNCHVQFHKYDKKNIISAMEETRKLFDLFNSRLFVTKYPISLDRYVEINNIPDAEVGSKKNGKWDYRSVLTRLSLGLESVW